jgi:hypothetical protein
MDGSLLIVVVGFLALIIEPEHHFILRTQKRRDFTDAEAACVRASERSLTEF